MSNLFPQPSQDPRATVCAICGDPNAGCIEAGQRKCVRCVSPSFWPKNQGQG